jgi:hypothetical protein
LPGGTFEKQNLESGRSGITVINDGLSVTPIPRIPQLDEGEESMQPQTWYA